MNRRGFLSGILAVSAAPAIVRAESLMKIVVPSQHILTGWVAVDQYLTFHGTSTGRISSHMPVFQQMPLRQSEEARQLRKLLGFEHNYGEFRRITTPLPDPFAHLFGT